MFSKNKQLIINMLASFIAQAVSMGISFFLSPFIVRNVGIEAYGFIGLANNFVSYVSIFVIALNSMVARHLTISIHRKEYIEANKYFTTVLLSNAVIAILLVIPFTLLVCFLEKVITVPKGIALDVKILWGLIFLNFLIGLITSVYGSSTYIQNRLDLDARRTLTSKILNVAVLGILFTAFQPHIFYVGLASAVCCVYVAITNVHYTKRLLPEIKVQKSYFDISKAKELVLSGIWNSIGKLSAILTDGLDLLIVNMFIGVTAMGSVSVAKVVPTLILSFFGMLAGVFMPQLNISYAKNDFEGMKQQVISSIKLLGFIACIPITCVYAYGDIFFSLWIPGENPVLLHWLAIVSSIEFPFILMLEPIWNVFTVMNKIKYSTLFLIFSSFLGILITFVLLCFTRDTMTKMFIIVGISSAVAIVRAWTFMPIYSAKCMHMKTVEFYKPIIKNTVAVVVVTVISVAIRRIIEIDTWIKLIGSVFITGAIALIINYNFILNSKEKSILKNKILRRE